MTPKEKAQELLDKMYSVRSSSASDITMYFAKQCALIAVDELIKLDYDSLEYYGELSSTDYWEEVRKEIEKL